MSEPQKNPLTGQEIPDAQLSALATLARKQWALEQEVERLEAALEAEKEQLRLMSQETIPDLMQELGMESFKLNNGYAISVKGFITAKIPTEDEAAEDPVKLKLRDSAFKWLRDNNYDAIIKRQIALAFGKGEDKKAERVEKQLVKLGVPFTSRQGVHPMTLKSFCRERIEAGDGAFPRELFGVFEGKKTVITPPKQ